MAKIAIFDPNMPKFTEDMVEYWSNQGHQVKRERYYNPELVEWADIVWFDTCDNNLKMGTNPPTDNPDFAGYDMHDINLNNKKVIVRIIDIEAWLGHHLNAEWDVVTDVIFIAPHIQKLVEKDIDFASMGIKTHLIHCGVNIKKFNFRNKSRGNEVAWVCERWTSKGIDYALQIAAILPKEYRIHALGIWNDIHPWDLKYYEDFIERNLKDRLIITERTDDVNTWLEDKDYILSCSKKEAFGYSIAEGMSKGLKPIIHEFYGVDGVWDTYTWQNVNQAVDMITGGQYDPIEYRNYLIEKGYTFEAMMGKIEEVIK